MIKPKSVNILVRSLDDSELSEAAAVMAGDLANSRIRVRLLVVGSYRPTPYNISDNVEVFYLGLDNDPNITGKIQYAIESYKRVKEFIRKEKVRNLFIWGKESTALVIILRSISGLEFKIIGVNVMSTSTYFENQKNIVIKLAYMAIFSIFLRKAEYMIAQSTMMVNELVENYKISKNRVSVVYPPINGRKFYSAGMITDYLKIIGNVFAGK